MTTQSERASAGSAIAAGNWRLDPERSSVEFRSDSAGLDGDTLTARDQLHAAGAQIPLAVDANMRPVDGELEIAAEALADHRQLGMTWSPLGILRAPSKLIVRGRLVRRENER